MKLMMVYCWGTKIFENQQKCDKFQKECVQIRLLTY